MNIEFQIKVDKVFMVLWALLTVINLIGSYWMEAILCLALTANHYELISVKKDLLKIQQELKTETIYTDGC